MKDNWICTTLDDVCIKITDGSHWSPKRLDEGIPMASVKDMTNFGFTINTCKKISYEDYKKLIKNDCKPLINDILIAKDGSYLKHVFVWKKNVDIAILSSIAILRPNKDIVEPEFLAKYLMSPLTKKEMSGYVTGAALPRIILKDFKKFKILLPQLSTQRKIASILSAYDDLIENNTRRIKILEEMAQHLYREWFVHFRYSGHENVKMVYNDELGKEIPEGWEVKKLGQILKKIRRLQKIKKDEYLPEGSIPTIDQGVSLIGGYTNNISAKHDDPLPIVVFGDHTRVVKYVDFPFASGADGTQLLYPKEESLMPACFYYLIKSIDLSNYAYARHFKFLKEQQILIPRGYPLDKFNYVVSKLLLQMSLLREKNLILRKTRDLHLPRLISGRIDLDKVN